MEELTFKDLKLNLDIKICDVNHEQIKLTKNEFNLLEFLIRHKNKIFTRQELLDNIWTSNASIRTVDATVSRLRKKIKDTGDYLTTRLGFGYGIIEQEYE